MLGDNLLAQRGQEATSLLCYLDRDPAREASLTHPKPKRPWIAKCLPTPSCAFLSSCCRLLCSSLANSCQFIACSTPCVFFSFLPFISVCWDRWIGTPYRVRLDIYLVGMEAKGKEEKSRAARRERNRRGKRSSGQNGARQKLPLGEERRKRPRSVSF